MDFGLIPPFAVGLLLVTSTVLLLSHDWRISIATLGVQYFGVFILVGLVWPTNLAVVKLVAGWMSASILGISRGLPPSSAKGGRIWPTEWLFRLMAASLVVLAGFSLVPQLEPWMPDVSANQIRAGLLLIGMGLLHLALTLQALHAMVALMTVLSGFEIIYAAVESSTLVAGLLAVINIGIAFVGAYLLSTHVIEESA